MSEQFPTLSKVFKPRWIKILLIIIVLFAINHYLQPGYYVNLTVKDRKGTVTQLNAAFSEQVIKQSLDNLNSHSYKYKDVTWEIIQPPFFQDWYVNFIQPDGKRADRIFVYKDFHIEIESMYFSKPYLFLTSHPGYLHIINVDTKETRTFDARSPLCKKDRTYLANVAYQDGTLYSHQFRDWSFGCFGDYKKKLELE
ncbi:MAG: hypothetical protein KW802_01775 [Candidatus Doudnabacteria bacterium]|nr:hypothetical protein [Candidatus Doudnabacteria bacterium]